MASSSQSFAGKSQTAPGFALGTAFGARLSQPPGWPVFLPVFSYAFSGYHNSSAMHSPQKPLKRLLGMDQWSIDDMG